MVKDLLLNLLNDLDKSTRISNLEVQEAFNRLAFELFKLNFNYKGTNFQIAEIEFASSNLKDTFHHNEQQLTMAKTYVHKTKKNNLVQPNISGFDITCGSSSGNTNYGTILVKAIRASGIESDGTNKSLRAILGLPADKNTLTDEEKNRFSLFDNLSIFDLFEVSEIRDMPEFEARFKIGERITMVGKKSETPLERSGALLRATNLSKPEQKKKLMTIDEIVTPINITEAEIFEQTVVPLVDVSLPVKIDVSTSDYNIAEKRYASLVDRTFEKALDYFLYYKICVEKNENPTFEDFTSFILTAEIEEQIFMDYSNVATLRAKNKRISAVAKSLKTVTKQIKNHIRAEFCNQIDMEIFKRDFFFKDNERHKRVCGYCGISEEEIHKLFSKHKIYTKRQYSRGKTLEVDKKDPNDLYKIDNIILACYWCNNAKTDEFNDVEFRTVAKSIRQVWNERLKQSK